MDHGPPTMDGGRVLLVSDEHVTFRPDAAARVGDRVRIWPAHVDPTVASHEWMHVVEDEEVVEAWPVDLRGW
jgi:D-serine deaminase-like pyridoxal phosphate-dependent protein